jgi:serine O-acetyltransferase
MNLRLLIDRSMVVDRRFARMRRLIKYPWLRPLARLVQWQLIVVDGCYLSPFAHADGRLNLPHPIGITIGHKARIGRNVTIYQHVTLGVRNARDDDCPTIEDDVIVYAGAVIVGSITIGRGAIIGANAVVTRSVPAGAVVRAVAPHVLARS